MLALVTISCACAVAPGRSVTVLPPGAGVAACPTCFPCASSAITRGEPAIVQVPFPVLLNSSTYAWWPADAPSAPIPIHGIVPVHLGTAAGAADTADTANADTGSATAAHATAIPMVLMRMLILMIFPFGGVCPRSDLGPESPRDQGQNPGAIGKLMPRPCSQRTGAWPHKPLTDEPGNRLLVA